jgi:Tol biopolymer transport system component
VFKVPKTNWITKRLPSHSKQEVFMSKKAFAALHQNKFRLIKGFWMIKTIFLYCSILFALAISSCSSNTSQLPVATSTLQVDPAADPGPDPEPDPVPEPEAIHPTLIPTNSAKIPVTWANLNLTGKLVYNIGAVDENDNYIIQIQVLDLVTGDVTVLYKTPLNAWIYYVSVSPDGKQLVMSYSPPLQENPNVVQALYVMPMDGSSPPQLLFTPPTREDQYTQAEWSPDGKYIYFTHVNHRLPEDPNRVDALYTIFRMEYPARGGGQPELIAEGAYWPRLSPDSSRLVYVSADPISGEHQLKIADPDGGNAQDVVLSGPYIPDHKHAPVFSPDGQSILFSGEVAGESYQPNWFEKLVGIRVAKANGDIPSDWWSVPVSGGDITQLTNIRAFGLYGSFSPDNQHIVSYSRDEIFVMKPDGSELTPLISGLNRFYGTVDWIP